MKINCTKRGNTLIVEAIGELDHHGAAMVREQVDKQYRASRARNLVFNLENLEFMDSSGIGVIVGRYKAVTAMGGDVYVVNPNAQVERIINISGLHKIIPTYKSVDAAIQIMEGKSIG